MAVQLGYKDLQDMFGQYPAYNMFSSENTLEENHFLVDNSYGKMVVTELKTPHFLVSDSNIQCYDDCKVYSEAENSDVLWFCAILTGNVTHGYYNPHREEKVWLAGQANLMVCRNIKMYHHYTKNKALRVIHFKLSAEYIERIALWYPHLFEDIVDRFSKEDLFHVFPENRILCPEIRRTLTHLMCYKTAGKAAALYLDAKIQEVLSLFVCQSSQKNCITCPCYSARDNEMLFQAREIVEQYYQNPLSLHQLALMAGTNVCKLKTGFKALFGTTVFDYLSDYRMDLACKYLLDTNKSIYEIAECIGYEYQSHFSTAFKRKLGLSPLEYRNTRLK